MYSTKPSNIDSSDLFSIDALIEAVRRKDFSNSQMMALNALLSLSGRLTSSAEPYIEAWLLKIAGFDQPYNALMKAEELRKHDNDLMETMVCICLVFGLL